MGVAITGEARLDTSPAAHAEFTIIIQRFPSVKLIHAMHDFNIRTLKVLALTVLVD